MMQMISTIQMQISTCYHANDLKDSYANVNLIMQMLFKDANVNFNVVMQMFHTMMKKMQFLFLFANVFFTTM